MVYYNYGRIKAISANIKESLMDLDNALAVYDEMKDNSNNTNYYNSNSIMYSSSIFKI